MFSSFSLDFKLGYDTYERFDIGWAALLSGLPASRQCDSDSSCDSTPTGSLIVW